MFCGWSFILISPKAAALAGMTRRDGSRSSP
jgi:hypothetical protein